VALDVTPAVRQAGGIGRYTQELARALLRRDSHQYVAFAADRVPARRLEEALGGAVAPARSSCLPARAHTVLWHRLRLPVPAELWTGPVDVFHATDFLAPPLARARSVVTVHDLSFLRRPDRAAPSLRRFLARAVPRAVRRAGHVLTDSSSTRRDVLELLGADPERVSVAYPGVGASFGRVTDAAELERVRVAYGLERPFVLGVGTLEARKDWPTLIAAFARAGSLTATHALVIAGGDGWLAAETRAAAGLARADVRLLGYAADRDLPALYTLADAFAYPSVYEGFGLPPVEAMACGAPTVVSDAPCLPEVVGAAALVVPAGDARALAAALVRLVGDVPLRARLAAAGVERAAGFTWDGCARAAERAYAAVVADC